VVLDLEDHHRQEPWAASTTPYQNFAAASVVAEAAAVVVVEQAAAVETAGNSADHIVSTKGEQVDKLGYTAPQNYQNWSQTFLVRNCSMPSVVEEAVADAAACADDPVAARVAAACSAVG